MKRNNSVIIAVSALVAVSAVALYALSRDNNMMDSGMMQSNQHASAADGQVNTASMEYKTYAELQGDAYDQMFIANMIEHHRGAVEMAELALQNAKHQELKEMAQAIIDAQTKEIGDMEQWQKEWNYPSSSGDAMMDHSAMGMMAEMDHMTEQLRNLTGNAFDKAFITSMIMHHQSAVNMAGPGPKNAKHDEVKALTKAVIDTQSKEILQMKQWQKDWGYE